MNAGVIWGSFELQSHWFLTEMLFRWYEMYHIVKCLTTSNTEIDLIMQQFNLNSRKLIQVMREYLRDFINHFRGFLCWFFEILKIRASLCREFSSWFRSMQKSLNIQG